MYIENYAKHTAPLVGGLEGKLLEDDVITNSDGSALPPGNAIDWRWRKASMTLGKHWSYLSRDQRRVRLRGTQHLLITRDMAGADMRVWVSMTGARVGLKGIYVQPKGAFPSHFPTQPQQNHPGPRLRPPRTPQCVACDQIQGDKQCEVR